MGSAVSYVLYTYSGIDRDTRDLILKVQFFSPPYVLRPYTTIAL